MIPRYEVPEISAIWSEENKFRRWLDVELAISEAWFARGKVPRRSWENIRRRANFDSKRIHEIEKVVKHDVIAFLTSVEEHVGADSAYIHRGVTSSDIVDTAQALLLSQSLAAVQKRAEKFKALLLKKAFAYQGLPIIGRTHGVHAEPIAFGLKFLVWHEEMARNCVRLARARQEVAVGKISGAVGTYSHFPIAAETRALRRLGLKPCRAATQVVQRDRHAEMLAALAILGSTIEKVALEIRHLQRTEVGEAEEPFSGGQKGSSAMPHKRNPVRCERLAGLSRLLRSYVPLALENNVLWHERDISHSSVERIVFPDAFHLAAFMLAEIIEIIGQLRVYPQNMLRNLDLTGGIYFSQKILTLLVEKGVPRQRAYEWVQKNALLAWRGKNDFRELILSDREIASICGRRDLERAFSQTEFLAGVRKIFARYRRQRQRAQ